MIFLVIVMFSFSIAGDWLISAIIFWVIAMISFSVASGNLISAIIFLGYCNV